MRDIKFENLLTPEEKIENLCLNILDVINENRYLRKKVEEQEETIEMYRNNVNDNVKRYNELFGSLLTSCVKGDD